MIKTLSVKIFQSRYLEFLNIKNGMTSVQFTLWIQKFHAFFTKKIINYDQTQNMYAL